MQDTLKQQILRLLLNGVYSQDIQAYLKRLDISLPGPFYYVLSIAFLQEKESGRLQNIKKELDQLILENPAEHIYTLHDITQKQLWVICSLAAKENEPEMTEYIVSIAQCYSIEPAIGIGRVYTSLSRISTSWLESIDNLTRIKKQTNKEHTTYVFNLNDLHWLEDFLSIGDKTATLNALTQFVNQLEKDIPSLIMLQYIFTEFIGEISRLGKRRGIELSSSSISLLISSKTIDEFHRAANEIIHDYFEKLSHQREQKNEKGDL